MTPLLVASALSVLGALVLPPVYALFKPARRA